MTCLIVHQHCRQKQVQHSMPSRAETFCLRHSVSKAAAPQTKRVDELQVLITLQGRPAAGPKLQASPSVGTGRPGRTGRPSMRARNGAEAMNRRAMPRHNYNVEVVIWLPCMHTSHLGPPRPC